MNLKELISLKLENEFRNGFEQKIKQNCTLKFKNNNNNYKQRVCNKKNRFFLFFLNENFEFDKVLYKKKLNQRRKK